MEAEPGKVTGLLKAWRDGDDAARERLIPLVYEELRRLASRCVRKAGAGNTLQTTALVHEAYLRLVEIEGVDWQDRSHFFAVCAQVMRRILVDRARARVAAKRGGAAAATGSVNLDEIVAPHSRRAWELVALDDALTSFGQQDARRARIIELRVFAGLTVEETAEAVQLSAQSVMRDWKVAKAWLLRELSRSATAPPIV